MIYVIYYFLIGLAITIGYTIYAIIKVKDEWEKMRNLCNDIYDKADIKISLFSASETYRCFIAGLMVIMVAWPVGIIMYLRIIYGLHNYYKD